MPSGLVLCCLVLLLGAQPPLVNAVDASKFRTCRDASFCRRFQRWRQRPNLPEALWLLLPGSCEHLAGGGFSYLLQHKHDAVPSLILKLQFFRAGSVRVRLTEIDPMHPRYETPEGDVVLEPSPEQLATVSVAEEPPATVFTYETEQGDEVAFTLGHKPVAFNLTVNGQLVQRVDERNFLNFERYRSRKMGSRDVSARQSLCFDAAAWPGADTNGLWEEEFNGHLDTKPRGPAAVGVDMTFEGEVAGLFGLPGHAARSRLRANAEPYRCFNLDVCEYELDSPMALYGTVPIIQAVHRLGAHAQVSGFLWLNPSDTFVGLESKDATVGPKRTWWVSESGMLDVVLLAGPRPQDIMRQYHLLTGFAPLPPLWSLGKHQSRWNYESEEDARQVNANYDKHDIPLDAVWLDIEHTDGKRYFTWDVKNFADPLALAESMAASGRKLVTIVDPHVKKDAGFSLYRQVRDAGLCIQTSGEEPSVFEGWCWPGTSVYPDFTHPRMRELWAQQFSLQQYRGTTLDVFTWNDMNEPSVFNGPEVTCPKDAVHPFQQVEHRDVHNLYGSYMQRASFEGHLLRARELRPFVLSRSYFAGSQRWGAVWTGDNDASWEHLASSVPMLLALALGGMSFAGADVGGFFRHPSDELLVRWYQLGAMAFPFFRQHAHEHSPRREPWLWGEETLERIRAAVQLRYQLLPYIYTSFAAYHRKGTPVLRPLWWRSLDDPVLVEDSIATEESLMVGEDLLVRGVFLPLAEQSAVQVYLPSGGWYDLHGEGFLHSGYHSVNLDMEGIPAYWRAGSIVPMKRRSRASSVKMALDPLVLRVFLEPDSGKAAGVVYIDDYTTNSYEQGNFLEVTLRFEDGVLQPEGVEGLLQADVSTRVEFVEIYGLRTPPSGVSLQTEGPNLSTLDSQSFAMRSSSTEPLYALEVAIPNLDLASSFGWSLRVDAASGCRDSTAPKLRSSVRKCHHQRRPAAPADRVLTALLAGAWCRLGRGRLFAR